ncbi:Mediator of RNA polymerase II transcription subunit 17 [Aphelenchoides besseyi]|nr:Mediator of RNA polymerase II transcription subunit 17 [Aphelenchoides besseyi]
MFRGIKLVSLDVTNTLIKLKRHPADVYAEFASNFGFSADREALRVSFPKAFKQLELENPCYGIKCTGPREWWTDLMKLCYGPSVSKHSSFPDLTHQVYEYYGTVDAWKLTSDENLRILRSLRNRGLKLNVLSNFDSRLHNILDDMQISQFFDRIFISGEVGFQKPDPMIFNLVFEHFKISDPRSCVHIGDDIQKDYRAAEAVGMNGVLIAKTLNPDVPREHQISSLTELESILMQRDSLNYTPSHSDERAETDGVDVAVESQFEWQIDHITYDGNESYIRPPEFVDVVAKNILKIPWKSVIEKSAVLDAEDNDESDLDERKRVDKEIRIFDSVREAAREKLTPVAGPWASVAKCLHESMQEVDVLLDTLRIAKKQLCVPRTDETYLNILKVSKFSENNLPPEVQNKVKGFCWVSRKKVAFEDALKVLGIASNVRSTNRASQKSTYFEELKTMRENWRIRKVNDLVYDGTKFLPSEIFDIFWNPKSKQKFGGCIEVQIPKNLMRRTKLVVSLLKDTIENQNEIAEPSQNGQNITFSETSRDVPWEKALKWAQDSLINGDIFVQLLRESMDVHNICIVTENALVVCLFDGMLLKFERHFYRFEEIESPERHDFYLSSLLRQMFVSDLLKPLTRPQMFIGFNTTNLPESLDFRGPNGLCAAEIQSRTEKRSSLLKKIICVTNHYILVDQVLEVLSQFMSIQEYNGTMLSWHWMRCTSTFSMISASLTNQGYEALNKILFTLHIHENEVHVISKDCMTINCYRHMTVLQETLNLMAASCQMFSTAVLAKTYGWNVLHANSNAFSKEGTTAPSFYCSNQYANKRLFVQYFTDGRPSAVYLKRINPANYESQQADDMDTQETETFTRVNCDRVPGSSLIRKLEFIFTMFRK